MRPAALTGTGAGLRRASHPPEQAPIRRAARAADLDLDPAQRVAAARLEDLVHRLGRDRRRRGARGVYLWGPVGRGKTWLLDAFFVAAPVRSKRRVHFHDLFRDLHRGVHRNRGAGHAFDRAVVDLIGGCDLLCFDELHLHDVGDAMLLTRLLRALFERGTVLVATSNYPPEGLLPDPLHHHHFEPGIELLLSRMDVVEVSGPVDYRGGPAPTRARNGFRSGGIVSTAGQPGPGTGESTVVPVGGRGVRALAVRPGLAWFDFGDLCRSPVSAVDMVALAERFGTWVVSDVAPLRVCPPDVRQRFVNLVDVLYDRGVALTLVTDAPPEDLLAGDGLAPDFQRTASRLRELVRSSCGA